MTKPFEPPLNPVPVNRRQFLVVLQAKNCPEADRLIRKTYREGWKLS